MVTINKGDFVELEFTGLANNEVFDTTMKSKAKEMGLNSDVKPVIASAGNEMLLKGLDEALIGKEVGKEYKITLQPDNAFGKRNTTLIKTVPLKLFREKNINPVAGMAFQIDGNIARILSANGGRIIVDFNNPLAGKIVEYEFKIIRKVDDGKEKINAICDFFFRKRFDFQMNEEDKKVIFKEEKIKSVLAIFEKKFKELTGLDFVVEESKKENKEESSKDSPKK